MIYFVDEDVKESEPYIYHLKYLGFDATIIDNADDAFDRLVVANDIEVIVLDVMLSTRSGDKSRFDAISTNNFVTTGLKLLDDLVQQRQNDGTLKIPNRVVLFSAATRPEIVSLICAKRDLYKIRYLNKMEFDEVNRFAEEIKNVIGSK
jgi:CheY-like chemotaxis protein